MHARGHHGAVPARDEVDSPLAHPGVEAVVRPEVGLVAQEDEGALGIPVVHRVSGVCLGVEGGVPHADLVDQAGVVFANLEVALAEIELNGLRGGCLLDPVDEHLEGHHVGVAAHAGLVRRGDVVPGAVVEGLLGEGVVDRAGGDGGGDGEGLRLALVVHLEGDAEDAPDVEGEAGGGDHRHEVVGRDAGGGLHPRLDGQAAADLDVAGGVDGHGAVEEEGVAGVAGNRRHGRAGDHMGGDDGLGPQRLGQLPVSDRVPEEGGGLDVEHLERVEDHRGEEHHGNALLEGGVDGGDLGAAGDAVHRVIQGAHGGEGRDNERELVVVRISRLELHDGVAEGLDLDLLDLGHKVGGVVDREHHHDYRVLVRSEGALGVDGDVLEGRVHEHRERGHVALLVGVGGEDDAVVRVQHEVGHVDDLVALGAVRVELVEPARGGGEGDDGLEGAGVELHAGEGDDDIDVLVGGHLHHDGRGGGDRLGGAVDGNGGVAGDVHDGLGLGHVDLVEAEVGDEVALVLGDQSNVHVRLDVVLRQRLGEDAHLVDEPAVVGAGLDEAEVAAADHE
mmetsp:Transcript_17509/g.56372  ORF Transcript_17509/g.56372 Transcript_17509/m.56372 type:complete len:562 (+) Transcript_17509:6237-7922(+)